MGIYTVKIGDKSIGPDVYNKEVCTAYTDGNEERHMRLGVWIPPIATNDMNTILILCDHENMSCVKFDLLEMEQIYEMIGEAINELKNAMKEKRNV